MNYSSTPPIPFGGAYVAPNTVGICPCCGYCFHCGRSGFHANPPYYTSSVGSFGQTIASGIAASGLADGLQGAAAGLQGTQGINNGFSNEVLGEKAKG